MLEYYQLAKRKWNKKKKTRCSINPEMVNCFGMRNFKGNTILSKQLQYMREQSIQKLYLFKGRLHGISVIL